jgi:hypothetical protein
VGPLFKNFSTKVNAGKEWDFSGEALPVALKNQ